MVGSPDGFGQEIMLKIAKFQGNNYVNSDLLRDYKQYPGPLSSYDSMSAHIFPILLKQGLNEQTCFLDVGCGPLRFGRFLMLFLEPNSYCAMAVLIPVIGFR